MKNLSAVTETQDVATKYYVDEHVIPISKGGTGVAGTVGSATRPVYMGANGLAVCTHSLEKSVPSNAIFTDTTALGSMTGTLGVGHGGTGADNSNSARSNLGVPNAGTYDVGSLYDFLRTHQSFIGSIWTNEWNHIISERHRNGEGDGPDYGIYFRAPFFPGAGLNRLYFGRQEGGGWTESEVAMFNTVYPVGAIYLSTSSTSPASLFGGSWEQIQNRFLLAAGSSYSAGATGGEANHTLSKAELPATKYRVGQDMTSAGYAQTWYLSYQPTNAAQASPYNRSARIATDSPFNTWAYTEPLGSGTAHNNMPPYLAVYVWKRTA